MVVWGVRWRLVVVVGGEVEGSGGGGGVRWRVVVVWGSEVEGSGGVGE